MGESTARGLLGLADAVDDETLGRMARVLLRSNLVDFQDPVRQLVIKFLRRNAMFKARVGSKNRITIPETDSEQLGLDRGDVVYVVVTPLVAKPEAGGSNA